MQVLFAPLPSFNPVSNLGDASCPQLLNAYNGEQGGIGQSSQQEGERRAKRDHSDLSAEFQGNAVFMY